MILTDLNSNVKSKTLHPLELEIQRDFELRQRQAVSKDFTPTIENSTDQLSQKCKRISASNSFFDGVMQLNSIPNGKNSVFNINTPKTPENVICQISPSGQQMTLEKKQYIILSDNSSVFNITSKDEEFVDKSVNNEIIKYGNSEEKSNLEPVPVIIHNSIISSNNNNRNNGKIIESDSENDDEDIEPVNDYEPDPDTHTVLVSAEHLEKPNKCYVCFRSFRQKKNMYAHIRKIHSTQPKIEGGILCPLCKMHALRQEHLRNHLESLHKISIEKEEKLFNTMEGMSINNFSMCPFSLRFFNFLFLEFFTWKEFMEKETFSLFVNKSSSKLLANNQQKTYYKCHRSGNYVTLKKENCKKKLKTLVSLNWQHVAEKYF